MTKYGIDVSRHNGKINWNQVKNSGKVDFAIFRAGYGKIISQKDSKFEEYYAQCNANQIPVGTYWYSYAMSEAEARQEANVFLQVIKGKQFAYPVYFDLEEPKQLALGRTKCSAIAKVFLETVEKAGYFVSLYMSKSHLETYITEEIRNRYAVWVAHYGISQTNYSGQFGMWQKSDTGFVPGISGNVDLDECYQDYPSLIQNAGLNGFVKSKPVKPDETPEQDAKHENMNFGQVLELLKSGKKVTRQGWNGKNMFLFLAHGEDLTACICRENMPPCMDSICMKTAQNTIVIGWFASQTDMLAEDWKTC